MLIVDRKKAGDADFLLQVKLGNISYEEVMKECNKIYNEIKSLKDQDIDLPDYIDDNWLSDLCIEMVERMGFVEL